MSQKILIGTLHGKVSGSNSEKGQLEAHGTLELDGEKSLNIELRGEMDRRPGLIRGKVHFYVPFSMIEPEPDEIKARFSGTMIETMSNDGVCQTEFMCHEATGCFDGTAEVKVVIRLSKLIATTVPQKVVIEFVRP